ncbi:Hypothetical predicted protein [Mytilus galloprovincialis]|uniref:C-type lectin domain-containing protein n=1 Tax=Mytilus galloprovincialis TaxID=29158 RepID=A0A8B6DNQ5_MYTGA|nr:Hypothetical predicted protein [Mytilus galloprovincialis]
MNFITVTIVCTMLVILVQSIVVKKKNCSNQNSGSPSVPDKISDATLIFFGSSKYLFVRYFANALEAKNSCSRVCGSLVEINNEEENTFLATTAKELKIRKQY